MTHTLLERQAQQEKTETNPLLFPMGFPWTAKTTTFTHAIEIYLKESNATGNVYFSRYFEWQGICREKWFFDCISADMLQPLGVFITKEASQKFIQETFAFQKVHCELNTFSIKQCSFSLLFQFFVGEKLVARGYQTIVFADQRKKIARLPLPILEKIRRYQASHDKLQSLGIPIAETLQP